MTEIPATADQGLRLSDARERMFMDHIHHLVVLKDEHLCGVLSLGDITLALSLRGVDATSATVADAMTSDPYACRPTTPVSEVAREMEAHGYGCVIVTDDEDEVVGIFTTTDALRALRQVVTGVHAEPLSAAQHLRPEGDTEGRTYRLRRHRSVGAGAAPLFTTSMKP